MVQVSRTFLLVFLLFLGTGTSLGSKNREYQSNCGVVLDIKPPFRFTDDSSICGRHISDLSCQGICWSPLYELSCQNNRTVLEFGSNTLSVESIDYQQRRIHTTYTGLLKGNYSSFPKSYDEVHYGPFTLKSHLTYSPIFILICRSPVRSPHYVDTAPFISAKDFLDTFVYSGEENLYSYAVIGDGLVASDIEDSCTVIYKWIVSPIRLDLNSSNISFVDIHNQLASGIDLSYSASFNICSGVVYVFGIILLLGILGRALTGTIVLIIFVIYKCKRRHQSEYGNIEQFLKGPSNLLPIRYSYKEIKQMTNNFKDKLGKGGYGDVYKGKSRSGYLVAVKMLNEAKGSGQDFINEVATIGRIYHLNVVRLVGFCVTSSKRALVYDYMPNGSLDKFIFSQPPNGLPVPLSWERTLEIAVGVAQGISYLHHGCHMQILHFDIKPHNILLDDNFVPKVSDFGLAKLCPRQKSAVTLTAAKGTLGYMAPELIYRKIGEVSHKADVYSFGQLLMAMVGRKKVNSLTDHSSRIYFPAWIYERVERGEEEDMDLDLEVITKEEKDIVRKIILVALCCVQWIPADRPSMREVVEMLEGDVEGLKLPGKPLYYFSDTSPEEERSDHDDANSEDSTSALYESTISETETKYASHASY